MKLYAIVKIKAKEQNDSWHCVEHQGYETKNAFLEDLRANGYVVMHNKIYTQDEFEQL